MTLFFFVFFFLKKKVIVTPAVYPSFWESRLFDIQSTEQKSQTRLIVYQALFALF